MPMSNRISLRSGFVTEDDLASYQRDGAICIRQVIDQETVGALRIASAEAVEASLVEAEANGKARPSEPHFHIMLYVHEHNSAFRNVLFNTKIAEVARDLMQSRKTIVFGDSLFVKEAGAKITTPWHHDIPFWPLRGEQVCTTWIALDHVTRESGALEYVSGSHRWGRMFRPKYPEGAASDPNPHHAGFEEIPDFDHERDRYEFLSWELAPGDMLIHHGMTVHGGGENKVSIDRRGYAPRFVGENATWGPIFESRSIPAKASRLAEGDPLDRFDSFPVALDLDAA